MDAKQSSEIGCTGGRSGSGPATWGQQAIWSAVKDLGPDAARYNVTTDAPVPPGVPAELVIESLQGLLLLHDSLRTRLLPEDSGALTQVADSSGSAQIEYRVCGSDDPAEAEQVGRELLAELSAQPFDTAQEWPIRVGIVLAAGQVRHMAFALAHTAVDAWGLQRMILNLTALASGEPADRISALRPAFQPLDEAAFQASERGRRQDAMARRHWRERLRLGPTRLFPAPAEETQSAPFPNALFHSPALALAVHRVAAGRQVSPASVLVAATAHQLCRLSGSPDAVLQAVVNNRFLPRLAHSVGTVAQEGLFHLAGVRPVGSTAVSFTELVRRAHAASLGVYRNAYYDKARLDQDIAGMAEQDGAIADLSCILNDYRGLMPQPRQGNDSGDPASGVNLDRERARTTLAWPVEFEPRRNLTFALDALDSPGAIDLSMTADGAVLSKADMEQFLYGIEDLVVGEALALDRG